MAKKLYILSQTPWVELDITSAPDAAGKTYSMTVGFKRKSPEESNKEFEELSKYQQDSEFFKRIKDNIIYLKNVTLPIYDENSVFVEEKIVADTRLEQGFEDFWGSSEECLSVLLDLYFESNPWKSSFISTYFDVLLNRTLSKVDEAKN